MASLGIATLTTHVHTPRHEHPAPIFVASMTKIVLQTAFILTTRTYRTVLHRRHLVSSKKLMFERERGKKFMYARELHLPTRGPRVGARGCFSISWVGSRLPRQKREKRVRGSGARVGSSPRNIDPRQFLQVLSGSVLGFNTVAGSPHSCKVTGQKSAGECGF